MPRRNKPRIYTTLRHVKIALLEGHRPPMTPLPEHVKRIIDPAFTIDGDGMGGLVEDYEKGLQCPVRNCGGWFHRLDRHLDVKHAAIGGERGLRDLLDLPRGRAQALTSDKFHRRAVTCGRRGARSPEEMRALAMLPRTKRAQRAARTAAEANILATFQSIARKNEAGVCPAQIEEAITLLKHRIIDINHSSGRWPTRDDAVTLLPPRAMRSILRAFGTWENVMVHIGAPDGRNRVRSSGHTGHRGRFWDKASIIASLAAWEAAHGSLPSRNYTKRYKPEERLPLLPAKDTILKAFNTTCWQTAMEEVAGNLNIYGGRYGLPIEFKPKEEAVA